MERTLSCIGKEWAKRDRKRRRESRIAVRDAQAGSSASASSEETVCEPEASEPTGSELQSVQLATALQQRLHDSIRGLIRDSNNRKIIAGQAFIARSCCMFVTTQAGVESPTASSGPR